MTLNKRQGNDWYFDLGATSHLTPLAAILSHSFSPQYPVPSTFVVGNNFLLPVTYTSTAHLPGSLRLYNALVSPSHLKNLIFVRQFTSDNNGSVEFDPVGCSVKVLRTPADCIPCASQLPQLSRPPPICRYGSVVSVIYDVRL